MPKASFQILNTSNNIGDHWIVIVKDYDGKMYFGDSMGRRIEKYKQLKHFHNRINCQITKVRVQQTPEICGLYAIFFAYQILNNILLTCTEQDLWRFVHKYYKF